MRGDPSGVVRPNGRRDEPVRFTVLSRTTIRWWAVLIISVGVGLATWLLLDYGGDDPQVRLDAIRTAGTIVIGTGGGAALLLAARRQRATEIALKQKDADQAHQERVAAAAETDALARRITELYARSADQLGSDKAPARLAALYALERLAQDHPDQRQTIVNLLCAYLRLPFDLPGDPPEDIDGPTRSAHQQRVQEMLVRRTAQSLLHDHLYRGRIPEPLPDTFWADIDLDLTGATLIGFNLNGCTLRTARFDGATFTGEDAAFDSTIFTSTAWFENARFDTVAVFAGASFYGMAIFTGATFHFKRELWTKWGPGGYGLLFFNNVTFRDIASFDFVNFHPSFSFRDTRFLAHADFDDSTFHRECTFERATFAEDVTFTYTTFSEEPDMTDVSRRG